MLYSTVTALLGAAPVIPTPDDFGQFVAFVLDAIKDKNYGYLAAMAIILFVWAAKKYGGKLPKIGPTLNAFLASDPGGVVAVFVGSFGIALATATAGGTAVSGVLLLGAVKVAFLAMGGYVGAKKALLPLVIWILRKLNILKTGATEANDAAAGANQLAADGKTSDAAAADALNKALDGK